MLRKRTRSHQREQLTNNLMPCARLSSYFCSDISSPNHEHNSVLNVAGPGPFVGFNPKNLESISPTSPLDFRIFSGFGNPFRRDKASPSRVSPKSWDGQKVGLSIIDSLDEETGQSGHATGSSCKSVIFGRRMSIRNQIASSHVNSLEINSLPEDIPVLPWAKSADALKKYPNVVFEIGEVPPEQGSKIFHSYSSELPSFTPQNTKAPVPSELGSLGGCLESGKSFGRKLSSSPSSVRSGNCFTGSIPASESELSEDYTCVTIHGPNPKVIHIFPNAWDASTEADGSSNVFTSYCSKDFLKFCYSCKKKLDGGDIYMYRGEKAFCSYNCRSQEIEIDEDMETTDSDDTSEIPSWG